MAYAIERVLLPSKNKLIVFPVDRTRQPSQDQPVFDPNQFVRDEVIMRAGRGHTIRILSEQIIQTSPDTDVVTQWILGHHPQVLLLGKLIQGWQGDETVRRIHRRYYQDQTGNTKFWEKEENLSEYHPPTSNLFGRIL